MGRLKVYYLGNLDGSNRALVAAPNQAEACRLMGVSAYSFRNFGGQAVTDADLVRLATSEVGRVWHQKIEYGPVPQPWVYARWQQMPEGGIKPYSGGEDGNG